MKVDIEVVYKIVHVVIPNDLYSGSVFYAAAYQ